MIQGFSYALATFTTTIAGEVLMSKRGAYMSPIARTLDRYSLFLIGRFNVPVSVQFLSPVLLATVFAFLWGLVFSALTRRTR